MLTEQQVETFQRDGFLNGGKVVADDQIAELKAQLQAVLDKGPDGFAPDEPRPVLYRNLSGDDNTPVWQIVNIWEACTAFEKLVYHPVIVGAISQLTGMDNLQVWHDQVQYKPEGRGGATGWHQDAPLWPTIRPHTPVSAWIPFEDADIENGCMWMMPGRQGWRNCVELCAKFASHQKDFFDIAAAADKAGFKPPADAPVRQLAPVPWPIKKGEVSFHHSLTWHGSPPNRSPRPRPAIAIHYMTGEARYVAGTQHPMDAFIDLPDGAPMAEAGDHFPVVCRNGKPVGIPLSLKSATA